MRNGIFNSIDMQNAVKDFNSEMKENEEGWVEVDAIEADEEDEDFNMDDFLKAGGVDVDELDDHYDDKDEREAAKLELLNKKREEEKKEK